MAETRQNWEFNAPQFFDFANPDDDENADAWFDQSDECDVDVDESGYGGEQSSHSGEQTSQSEEDGHERNNDANSIFIEKENKTETVAKVKDTSSSSSNRGQKRLRSKDHRTPTAPRRVYTPEAKRARASSMRSGSIARQISQKNQQSGTRRNSAAFRRPLRPSNLRKTQLATTKAMRMKTTIPVTPECLKRKTETDAKPVKSSEELEVERIEAGKRHMEEQLHLTKTSYQQLNNAQTYVVPSSTKQLTKPAEFNFQTDNRIKNHNMETRQDIVSKDFASMLRKDESDTGHMKTTHQPKGPTVPKPFQLHENRSRGGQGYRFVSDAEKMISFHKSTPDRFHTKPRNHSAPTRQSPRNHRSHITVAKTPNLETRSRKRNIHIVSQDELEKQNLEDMKRYKFRARPLNQKVMEQADSLPAVPVKETTVPRPFTFHAESKSTYNAAFQEEEKHEFHAQPVMTNILEGVVGVKPAREIHVTVPESPAFALKNRVRSVIEKYDEDEQTLKKIQANPVPSFQQMFQPKLYHKKTIPKPFSFAKRDEGKAHEKEDKIKQILDEEIKTHEFHANPLPSSSPDNLPEKRKKPMTNPRPFNLESDIRGSSKTEEWTRRLEDELKQQRSQVQFKARPNWVTTMKPFEPKKQDRTGADSVGFELATDRRAVERREFERRKKEKECELEAVLEEARHRKEAEEEEEITRLRSETVHKSQPIRHYKPVMIHPSTKALTAPESPRFSDRLYKK